MPVSVLLCEGVDNGPDVRLLGAILRGTGVSIEPSGGKDGFSNLVRSRRRQNPRVCGLSDGDFPRKPETWTPPTDAGPRVWKLQDAMLGWMWQRKEVENYFIDPDVLQRALRWDAAKRTAYVTQLERLLDALGHATAARIALTACAPRKLRLDTAVPLDATEDKLREHLRERARVYNDGAGLDVAKLIEAFERHAPECLPGGRFRARALEVFAGKDVFARLQNTSGFAAELKNKPRLEETILDALLRDEAPHEWLPEWTALRAAVMSWLPGG